MGRVERRFDLTHLCPPCQPGIVALRMYATRLIPSDQRWTATCFENAIFIVAGGSMEPLALKSIRIQRSIRYGITHPPIGNSVMYVERSAVRPENFAEFVFVVIILNDLVNRAVLELAHFVSVG